MLGRFGGLALLALLAGCSDDRKVERAVAPAPPPVRILHFYASPGIAESGQTVTLCYGVENAQAVRLEPPLEPLRPAPNRCIQFAARQGRTYRLVATGADGKEVAEAFTLRVQARAAQPPVAPAAEDGNRLIQLFLASPTEARSGQPVLLCYGVRDAQTVRLDPGARKLEPAEKRCLSVTSNETTTYTLTAAGAGGATERQQVTVQIK